MLSKREKLEIKNAISEAEKRTSGEIRVHLERKYNQDIFELGKKVFNKLKMYKTKERNGVLIIISLESKKFAILGDKGIHEKVGNDFWDETKNLMLNYFINDKLKEGIIEGVLHVGEKLKHYFPCKNDDKNELKNEISEG